MRLEQEMILDLIILMNFCKTLICMHLINKSNDSQLKLNFIDMVYIIVAFNPTVDFVIWIYGKELFDVSWY